MYISLTLMQKKLYAAILWYQISLVFFWCKTSMCWKHVTQTKVSSGTILLISSIIKLGCFINKDYNFYVCIHVLIHKLLKVLPQNICTKVSRAKNTIRTHWHMLRSFSVWKSKDRHFLSGDGPRLHGVRSIIGSALND